MYLAGHLYMQISNLHIQHVCASQGIHVPQPKVAELKETREAATGTKIEKPSPY